MKVFAAVVTFEVDDDADFETIANAVENDVILDLDNENGSGLLKSATIDLNDAALVELVKKNGLMARLGVSVCYIS